MTELRQLLWLESKRLGAIIDYVLRIFGVDDESNRLYTIYVSAFLILWLFTAWSYLTTQVEFISRNLNADNIPTFASPIPILIIVAQWLLLVFALRESPVKMSAPDLALVATSPIRRSILVVVYWLKTSAIFAILIGIAATLLTMLFTNITQPELAGIAGGWSFLVAITLTWTSGAVIWAIALLKLHLPLRNYRIWFWLIPIFAILLFILLPAPFMFMGNLWMKTINNTFSSSDALILALLFIVSTGLLILSGANMHLAVVADDSQRFARIQRMGIFGQIYARDVISRINRQSQLGSRSQRRFSLPKTMSIPNSLWQRAFLSIMRLAPVSILNLIGLGARYTIVIAGLIILFGWQAPQIWLIVAVMILVFRPTALVETFQQSIQSAFVRQFLPSDNMPLLILADSIVGILIASFGGWIILLTVTRHPAPYLLVPLGLSLLTLCQALTWFKPSLSGGGRIAYEYSAIASSLFVIGAGYLTGDLWVAVMASLTVIWILLNIIKGSRL